MVVKKSKDPSWDKIGEQIGKKMEKDFSKEGGSCKSWTFHHENGGCFGRLLFIVSILLILNHLSMLNEIPLWMLVLLAIGFTAMRF